MRITSRHAGEAEESGPLFHRRYGQFVIDRLREHRKALVTAAVWTLGLLLIAKGQALWDYSYSIDAYTNVGLRWNPAAAIQGSLSQGRAVSAGMIWLLGNLGLASPSAAFPQMVLTFLLSIPCVVALSVIIAGRAWKSVIIVIAVFVNLHPYTAEIFTFRDAVFYAIFANALALGGVALFMSRPSWGAAIAAAFMISIGVGAYQLALNYIAVALLMGTAFRLACTEPDRSLVDRLRLPVAAGLVVTASMPLYFLINMAGVEFAGLFYGEISNYDSRSGFVSMSDISVRAPILFNEYLNMFSPIDPLTSDWVEKLALIGGGLTVAAALWFMLSRGKVASSALFLVALFGASVCVIGVAGVAGLLWLVPRVLSAISVLWAGIGAIAIVLAAGTPARYLVVSWVTVLGIAYVGATNAIFFDQARINRWDRDVVSRMVDRLEESEGFSEVRRVAVIGVGHPYAQPVPMQWADMNLPALNVGWTRTPAINEITGYNFQSATNEEVQVAINACVEKPHWPLPGSVTIDGEFAYVCN